jgi:lysophospholipase L1-like esterase
MEMSKMKLWIVFSLLLNILFISGGMFLVHKKGGLFYIKSKVASITVDEKNSYETPYYTDEVTLFELENFRKNKDVVFLGDSLIDYCEWNELLQRNDIANRGIAGDTTEGLLHRLSSLKELNPSKIFILIGINDIQQNVEKSKIVNNYKQIIEEIKRSLPNTEIYIESILYVNPDKYNTTFFRDGRKINSVVKEVNKELKNLAKEESVNYLDISSILTKNNELDKKYTTDGLHLNGAGYSKLKNILNEQISK